MKKLFFVLLLFTFVACSKDKENSVEDTTGTVTLKFVKNKTLSNGSVVEENFKMSVVQVWKADNKELKWGGTGDGEYALEESTGSVFKADYQYSNLDLKNISLPAGKYFVAAVSGLIESPIAAHTYTHFNVKKGENVIVQKNVTGMKFYSYNAW
ncbi:MAG TPA: hypothetical protein PKA53_03735 [Sphingobacterium sp.]|nr:hypothetical protein [Sphingobacterium sp.]